MSRRVLLAGGTGLVGRRLVPALVAAGWGVTAMVRGAPPAGWGDLDGVSTLSWAGGDAALPDGCWDGIEAVVNLAGAPVAGPRWSAARKAVLRGSRIDTTARLANGAEEAGVSTLINAGGVAIYGRRGGMADEDTTPMADGFLGRLAQAWEAAAASFSGRRLVLRIGVVLAPEGGALESIVPPCLPRLAPLLPLGDGRQALPWIHIQDLVGAMLSALVDPRWSGPVNLVAPQQVDNRSFTAAAAAASGHPYLGLGVPGPVLHLALGEQADIVLTGRPVRPERLARWGYQFLFPELGPALVDCLAHRH